ncbi:MAG: alkaline phosphatase family protein [Rhodospirillales bacterium]|nr:alkaline phosphatase family protein [Rhodospirillales bacterium]MDE2198768.1 alkaline phosphatase family protein [Rhodospirillales bacterium]MDE2574275.1 alkaline phosphatase family protein [Rhodospirillales bacterium]
MMHRQGLLATAALMTLAGSAAALAAPAPTATPIQHLVVLFNENVSFDHYFATYPKSVNKAGEPAFTAAAGTPAVNNLAAAHLLTGNPNAGAANGAAAAEPFRLDRSQAATADQNHAYTAEQQAYNGGKADLFPKFTGKGSPGGKGAFAAPGQVMGYYDGNTVTGLWQYAQHFAMSDNAYTDTYGPSTPGALEVVAGQTNGMHIVATTKKPFTMAAYSYYINDGQGGLTMINDVDPADDVCSSPKDQVLMTGKNIGDLLNAAHISWGGFMGGFDLSVKNADGSTGCKRSTLSTVVGAKVADYIPHHNWFQYYTSTANPTHARPSSVQAIGSSVTADGKTAEPANHEYDLNDFYAAVRAGNFPAVSFIKLPSYQDGHAGYSDPLDEQAGSVQLINFLEQQPDWKTTAVVITWDDSDGWYDHAFTKPTNASADPQADQLDGPGKCGTGTPLAGVAGKPVNGRCGPGTRIPFLVISPWVKANSVSHTAISQASVVRFIEDNWLHGARLGGGSFDATTGSMMDLFDFKSGGKTPVLFLDPATGTKLAAAPKG